MKLAVIGTAGRKDDAPKMNATLFNSMYEKLLQTITHIRNFGPEPVTGLVSGGAAWADHLAVHHFLCAKDDQNRRLWGLERTSLDLHLPCNFSPATNTYEDNGDRDWLRNPGGTLNYYHRKMPFDSLRQIATAMSMPHCRVVVGGGLKGRNSRIAESADALVAFTFGSGHVLKPGGTAHTLQEHFLHKLFSNKCGRFLTYHVDLNTMLAWPRAELPQRVA